MAGKRKRSRKTPRLSGAAGDDDEDDDLAVARRASRQRVNYAESDDDEFEMALADDDDDEDEDDDGSGHGYRGNGNDEDEEPEAEETPDEDEKGSGDERGRTGKSLHVRLRLRKSVLGNGSGGTGSNGSAAAQDVGTASPEDKTEGRRSTRRSSASGRQNSVEKQEQPSSAGKGERRLSGTSIRQQLLQEAAKPTQRDRSKKSTRSSSHQPDDDEFEIESESESAEDDDDEPSFSSGTDNGIVDDSDFSIAAPRRRSTRVTRTRSAATRSRKRGDTDDDDDDHLSLQRELSELSPPPQNRRKNLRARREVNYQIIPPPIPEGYDEMFAPTESRKRTNTGGRRLYSTYGPFGGAGVTSLFGVKGPGGLQAAGGAADSDSSDDEAAKNPTNKLPNLADLEQVTNPSSALGLVKKNNLSDTDPLGVDMNIDFSAVGGLDEHIRQLKEMVALPLLYPEVFQRFKVTPPRGVLFHGPPGTGKTLLARALAASCSTDGRKISFYMRKGADALSKWVGEAERQLRLLFEEAKNTQPSIIFFDEIDGLAPVRSSKQEQIHASIVSTLLALMDGMDNRGQVIVIGATNRPDSIDPALRRPGRFDREFYFPLPNVDGRKKIIEIQTKGWNPPLQPEFVDEIATLTKGYGGADIRALCTESALNAIQRRYPQIYTSSDKLVIDPSSITVSPRDFIISLKKIIPSSQRSTASNAAPIPKRVEPLLSSTFDEIKQALDHVIPRQKKLSVMEEAMYEEDVTDNGFARENMMQEFESSRVFRPRILIAGAPGMGQEYLGAAVMQYLEGYHVQTFDLATLLGDPTRTVEAAIVQLFVEVKRHTPSVIFIPNIDSWYKTLTPSAWTTFQGLLRGISPVEQILLLAVVESGFEYLDHEVKALFGFSRANRIEIQKASYSERYDFFKGVALHISNSPKAYPDLENRKRRKLEELPKAPPDPPKVLSKAELKAQEDKDKRLKNYLKIKLSGLMDLLKVRYKRFRKPPIDDEYLAYLFDGTEIDPNALYEYSVTDDEMILQRSTGKKYHNMDLDVIEDRLWNGYYCTPKQFLRDISFILEDSNTSGDREKILKASEMYANVLVSVDEIGDAQFLIDCERVLERETQRAEMYKEKQKRRQEKMQAIQAQHKLELEEKERAEAERREKEEKVKSVMLSKPRTIENMFSDEDEVEEGDAVQSAAVENGDAGVDQQPVGDGAEGDGGIQDPDEMQIDPPASTTVESASVEPEIHATAAPESSATVDDATESPSLPAVATADTSAQSDTSASQPNGALVVAAASPSPEPEEAPHAPYELDKAALESFHQKLAHETDKFTIEQLEQLNSAIMDVAYRRRQCWDRNLVLREAAQVAEDVSRDIATAVNRD
ncbi:hypothetical protein BZA70DRAFT_27111 [Myxozyma melibiosi]|uniref:AAA+ ATPase domain-containing protein n=1 Tax=Myxozyma melibiosi TaxID=54550 RepID=A0ABR1FD99_9ASCO